MSDPPNTAVPNTAVPNTGVQRPLDPFVVAANRLTSDWVATMPAGSFVCSGAGVYPLLAMLSSGASGPAADELRSVVGVDVDPVDAVRATLEVLRGDAGAALALAVWVKASVELDARWVADVPDGGLGRLPDDLAEARRSLDQWVVESTNGRLSTMPVPIDDETLMVLASGLLVEFAWAEPFHEGPLRWGESWVAGLWRTFRDLDLGSVIEAANGPVGRFVSVGTGEVDVHLLTADGSMSPADVIAAGVAAVGGDADVRQGSTLPIGTRVGGLAVEETSAYDASPTGRIGLPAFVVGGDLDLGDAPEVFGLRSAFDSSRGHFEGISTSSPIAVQAARQTITASFTREGFVAAAVSAVALMAGAGMGRDRATSLSISLVQPFGFVAVHRPTGLALVAGWVEEPGIEPQEMSMRG